MIQCAFSAARIDYQPTILSEPNPWGRLPQTPAEGWLRPPDLLQTSLIV
ncbi:hypothetical protein H6F90_22945 [Trichocoleus sp. FACHB-591]|nr:hypothetical protein [Trichocoleus sp. FACHB-591]MBD2097933.1 hypothetical protein [Trichocoleus sp. FACHB-591]